MDYASQLVSVGYTVAYLIIFLIIFAESGLLIGFFLPGDSFLFTIGILSSQGHFSLPSLPETTNTLGQAESPLTELVRYLHFSYWDGVAWVESWSSRELPLGVTVTLAFEPVPEGMEAEDMEVELYRRVIAVPAQGSNRQTRPSARAAVPPPLALPTGESLAHGGFGP